MRYPGLICSFVCLMLAACTPVRPPSPGTSIVALTGMDTLHYPPVRQGTWGVLPVEVQAVMANLPEAVAPLDRPALTALSRLRYARAPQREFFARSDDVTIWIRRFDGRNGGPSGLALQIKGTCNHLPEANLLASSDYAALARSCARRERADFDTGLLLFKILADGQLLVAGEAEGQLFPRLSEAQQHALDSMGVSPPFADIPMLATRDYMAVWREEDPERPLPEGLAGTSPDHPGLVHGGDIVWTGAEFRIRQP